MCVARLQPLLQQPRPTITTTAATRIHLLSSRSFSQPTSPAFCLLPSSPSCSPILGQTTKLTALQVQLVSAAAAFNYDNHHPPPPPFPSPASCSPPHVHCEQPVSARAAATSGSNLNLATPFSLYSLSLLFVLFLRNSFFVSSLF